MLLSTPLIRVSLYPGSERCTALLNHQMGNRAALINELALRCEHIVWAKNRPAVYSLTMAVSERTRKILWVKAGGRCSICRVQVVGEHAETGDPSVYGEEAHIIARSAGGPRADSCYVGEIDSYDNLVLLCSKCHKQIDDQVEEYPAIRLRQIKCEHEEWVTKIGAMSDPGPVRLVPDPKHPVPKALRIFTNGTTFWNFFSRSKSFVPRWPAGLSDQDEDLIAEFFQDLEDWLDCVGGVYGTFSENRNASKAMSHHISKLAKAGFLVGARRRCMLLTGGIDATSVPWLSVDIEIHRASDAVLTDSDGKTR